MYYYCKFAICHEPIVMSQFKAQIDSEGRYRPRNQTLRKSIKADLESGLTMPQLQEEFAPYGDFKYVPSLSKRSRASQFRFAFTTSGKTAFFQTLSQAQAFLEEWKQTHNPLTKPGCLTCACSRVSDGRVNCLAMNQTVEWSHVWTMPQHCKNWTGKENG